MTAQITIIGLGQMGGSIGLALAAHSSRLTRLGHDKDPETAHLARKLGAVDSICYNLPAAVQQADIVLLAVPLNEVYDTLKHIAQDLKEGAVVIDTSPAKRQVERWALDVLPPRRYYLGIAAAVQSAYLQQAGGGLQAAHADLFQDAVFFLCPPSGTPAEVADLGMNLARLVGARPIFSDAMEVDGLLATMSTLPHLLTVSLIAVTADQPGWQDARFLAGRSYGAAMAVAFDREDANALCEAALLNRENVVHALDRYLAALTDLRRRIADQDREGLRQLVHQVYQQGHRWLAEPRSAGPASLKSSSASSEEPAGLGQHLRQMVLGRLFDRPLGKQ